MALAIGLMSGTSLDGMDAALLEQDESGALISRGFVSQPYDQTFREALRSTFGGKGPIAAVEEDLTRRHAQICQTLLRETGVEARDVTVIGFHGQTILHEPEAQRTWQIGDGKLLAQLTAIDVVNDFRSADVAAGGEGAPLAPLYHAALAQNLEGPLAVLNLGGVGNVTWIGSDGPSPDGCIGQTPALLAFDTGPGNALLDDWVKARAGIPCDLDGRLAFAGAVEDEVLAQLLSSRYFLRQPPKSLDRDAFDPQPVQSLTTCDGAATLTAFSAAAVALAQNDFPAPVKRWLVTGGGRHNPALMQELASRLDAPVSAVEQVGWNGDAIEAEAFAYLALRSLAGLPLSVPGTTSVPAPQTGGALHHPEAA
ncbi:anhydro-N-acetylmuramic acid kinase [Rhodovibrionaceae bacterium A322]